VFRRAIVAAVIGVAALGVSTPAFAHVTVQPSEAEQGGFATVAFQVPNEKDDASTVRLEVTFPADHPIQHVSTQPVEGWTVQVEKAPLDEPITGEGDPVTEAVSKITWSGGSIEPGQFQRFPVSMGPLPETASLEFKSVQTYSDGEEVRWIESATPGGEEPERPAPTLTLAAATGDGHGADSSDSADTAAATLPSDVATTSDVDSAKTVGIIGIVIGALALTLAFVALVRRPKAPTS
jgi:uncharacterized protein YcnI